MLIKKIYFSLGCQSKSPDWKYQGTLKTTKSGLACEKLSDGTQTYCRADKGPAWCNITGQTKSWEYCDVPYCLEGKAII